MAKGDSSGGTGGAPQAPKMDQYSVMHRMFDHFSPPQQGRGIGPQQGFSQNGPSTGMNYNPNQGMGGGFKDQSNMNNGLAPLMNLLGSLFNNPNMARPMQGGGGGFNEKMPYGTAPQVIGGMMGGMSPNPGFMAPRAPVVGQTALQDLNGNPVGNPATQQDLDIFNQMQSQNRFQY